MYLHEMRKAAVKAGGAELGRLLEVPLETKINEELGIQVVLKGAGEKATLDFLVKLSATQDDFVLNELIAVLPTVSSLGNFLRKMPSYKVTPEEFEYLVKLGHIL